MQEQAKGSMRGMLLAAVLVAVAGAVGAKLPPPSDEAKAKAEEAKAKSAEVAKKDAELLTKAQDRTAAMYTKEMKAKGVTVKPTPIPPPAVAPAPAAAAPAKK